VVIWDRLTLASALTVSYTSQVQSNESLLVDAYDTLSAISFYRSTADRLVRGATDEVDRVQRLIDWTTDNVRPHTAAPLRFVPDNFYDIVRRGFGYCDQASHIFATLAHFAGYESRLLFLWRADNTSPHTIAEVRLERGWVGADPWLGVLWRDRTGNPVSVQTLVKHPEIFEALGYPSFGLQLADFERSTIFQTFPYQSPAATVDKVLAKVRSQPIAPPPVTLAAVAGAAASVSAASDATLGGKVPATDLLIAYDHARRLQLEGRYLEAIEIYGVLRSGDLPLEMTEAVDFFVGLAHLRSGNASRAAQWFAGALSRNPDSEWRNSLLIYRGLSLIELEEFDLARESLIAADIVQNRAPLSTLPAVR
jgi:hypothetical protein